MEDKQPQPAKQIRKHRGRPRKTAPAASTTPSNSPDLSAALDDGPDAVRSTPYPDIQAALGLGDDGIPVTEVLSTIVCRKPRPTEFFRAHPNADMAHPAWVFINREEIGAPTFMVMPEARPFIQDHLRPVLLVVCVNRQSVPFLWPIMLPDPNSNAGRQNKWGSSALEALEIARKKWIKLVAGQGYYRTLVAESDELPEPVWLDKSFNEIAAIAFKEDLIDGPSHPIVQRLRGLR
jgi:hypothetical protein